MPDFAKNTRLLAVAAAAIDLCALLLLALCLSGGVSWHGHVVLRHAADPRRALILVCAAGEWLAPGLRERSFALRALRAAWRGLSRSRGARWGLLAGTCLYAAVLGALQALALRVPLYDVGIFHQLVWSIEHGHGYWSTISGAGSYLLDHFEPAQALLVPLFALAGDSPLVLPVVQPFLLYGGVAAWLWLAEREAREGEPTSLPAAVVVFAATFESFWGNLHWGFHESSLAFPALCWAYALLFSGRGRAAAVPLFLLAALCKEILAVDVALALALWAALLPPKPPVKRVLLALAAVALVAGFVYFEQLPHPADKNYFDRYYSYLGSGLGGFFKTLLLSPWKVVQTIGAGALAKYCLAVFLPWLFLPLLARNRLWVLAVAPSVASAALSTDRSLRGASFHYVLELWPLLGVLTVLALARRRSRAWIAVWVLVALLGWDHDPVGALREYATGGSRSSEARALLARVPPDASLSADELAGPWAASREWVTRWPALTILGGRCPEWLFLDGRDEAAQATAVCGPDASQVGSAGDWTLWHVKPRGETHSSIDKRLNFSSVIGSGRTYPHAAQRGCPKCRRIHHRSQHPEVG